jgi:hypothetical protein
MSRNKLHSHTQFSKKSEKDHISSIQPVHVVLNISVSIELNLINFDLQKSQFENKNVLPQSEIQRLSSKFIVKVL